jgi:RNA polymerase sigma-70 factor (ECF subfamily)
VLRFAARRLPLAEAEDVTAEAALALLEAQRDGRPPLVPGAYLLGVARRRIADRMRRSARGHVPVALPEGWDRVCDRALPDEVVASRELAELVEVALGFLPAASQALVRARYREGVSVAELASRLDCSEKAVEGRLARARGQLKELLLEAGAGWLEHHAGGEPAPPPEERP